jgi:hypothetical protein
MSTQSEILSNEADDVIIKKRKIDYIFLLASMVLSFVSITPLSKLLSLDHIVQQTLSTLATFVWFFFCYRVTANFYKSKWIRIAYASLLIFQLSLDGYIFNQANTPISSLVLPASIGYVANLCGFSLVFHILLKDVFMRKHDLTYSLLGASNIYFLIPPIFCYLYSLIAVHNPSIVNADPLNIKEVFIHCWEYSWYVLAGMEYPAAKIGEELQSIAILESISANLFVVFIIGRLMMK